MPSDRVPVEISSKPVSLVTFVHGTIKRESRKRKLKIHAFKEARQKPATKKRRIMIAESKKMQYKGDNFGPLSTSNQSSQLYLAAVDSATGQVTMHPADIFNLHPVMKGELQSQILDLELKTFQEKTDLLTDAFGSGKQKKALNKRRDNKMSDKVVSSAMGSAFETAVVAQQSLPATVVQETSSAIPPYNKDASSPDGVYSLYDIIGTAEIESLKNAAQTLFQCENKQLNEWEAKKEYHSAVLSRLQILPMDEEQRLKKACLLLYLHYMISLFHYNATSIRKKDPLPAAWPVLVKNMMLDRFTLKLDGNKLKRCLPARLKDLLISHILVLCLILDNFSSPLWLLQKDLKVSAKKLLMHARALGCKVKSMSQTNSAGLKTMLYEARLSVPLTFPEPSKGKKSKK